MVAESRLAGSRVPPPALGCRAALVCSIYARDHRYRVPEESRTRAEIVVRFMAAAPGRQDHHAGRCRGGLGRVPEDAGILVEFDRSNRAKARATRGDSPERTRARLPQ